MAVHPTAVVDPSVNRGTKASGITTVGEDCLLMAYAHVGIGDGTVISGLTGVHQFVTIGPGCFIGGGLRAIKDILPFTKGLGDPMRYGGLNPIGLGKFGFSPATGPLLKAAYRALSEGGREALSAWAAERAGRAGTEEGRLAEILAAYLARQTRSLLTRPTGGRGAEGSADEGDVQYYSCGRLVF